MEIFGNAMEINGNSQIEIAKRLSEYIEFDAITTPSTFAAGAGIDASGFHKMLKGQQKITNATLKKIADAYNLNMVWLLTGNGDMYAPKTVQSQTNQSGDNIAGDKIQLVGMDAKAVIEKEQKRICDLEKEIEHLNNRLKDLQGHIDTLKSQLADKDDIIALLKENRK